MAKAKTKTTRKPATRKTGAARSVNRVTEKPDPIFKAMKAWDTALGRSLIATGDEKNWDDILDAVSNAETQVAETVPTTFLGIEASARWFVRFIAYHDGLDSLNGYHPVEVWPLTINTALREFARRFDPAHNAVSEYRRATERYNAHTIPESEYIEAQEALMRVAPKTGLGLAAVLEAFFGEMIEEGSLEGEQREWAGRLIEAARALP